MPSAQAREVFNECLAISQCLAEVIQDAEAVKKLDPPPGLENEKGPCGNHLAEVIQDAEVVKKLGPPPGLENEKGSCGNQTDEDTTEYGSCLSDGDASCFSDAVSLQGDPARQRVRSKPAVVSRQNAQEGADQETFVGTSPHSRAPVAGATHKEANGRQQAIFDRDATLKLWQQLQVPCQQMPLESEPLKIESVAFSRGAITSLDPLFPAKKRPIFTVVDAGASAGSFDALCPLKKRVTSFLLEEPPRVAVW